MKNGKNHRQSANNGQTAYRYKKIKEYVYDMQAVLGKGNFSTVYKGRNHDHCNEEVAVKVVKLSSLTFQKLQELLEQEIAISRMLDHPNTIRCYQVLKSVNHCYFITELCEEGTLEKLVKKRGSMSQAEIWPYVRDVYAGLKYLNSKNIVHRDIKLANIFLKKGTAKLADFGFAVSSKQQFKDINIGSPLYMSPEGYIDNIYGPKTDVWAFGLVIYQMLHGKAPLSHIGTQEELKKLLRIPIKRDQFRADISEELKDLVMHCLEVDEKKRISMLQIEQQPYFQNSLNPKFMSEVKMNALRFRRLSVPNNMQFMRTPVKNLGETVKNVYDKENMTPTLAVRPEKESCKYLTAKELPAPQRMTKVPSDEIEENTSIMLDYRDQDLIRAKVTFNQSIGLIHFCRIGFKLMQEKVSCQLGRSVKSVVLKILEELKMRINSDRIVYTDDENRDKKESKLKLVVTEYLAKYGKEMQGERVHVMMPHLSDMLRRQLLDCEKSTEPRLSFTYLCMLFSTFTECLISAMKSKHYALFGENGVIDNCLQQRSFPESEQLYSIAKRKYQSFSSPLVIVEDKK